MDKKEAADLSEKYSIFNMTDVCSQLASVIRELGYDSAANELYNNRCSEIIRNSLRAAYLDGKVEGVR